MRNLKRQVTAILTAAVMTLSAAAGTVSALDGQQEASKYTGWATSGEYWQYLADGEPYNSGAFKIDGVMCDFSLKGYYIGTYSGWKNGRFYKDGLPYTGLTDTKDGKKYCLDGYAVTGEFPVGNEICKFSGKGIYKGSRTPDVAVTCDERVSTDTEKITVTLESLDDEDHYFLIAKSFEYLKNGKWESCKNGNISYAMLDNGLFKKGRKLSFEVDVQEYARNKFNKGFYRLPIISGDGTYYAVFEAVAPIELKSKKEEYVFANTAKTTYGAIQFDMKINSDQKNMQPENIIDIEFHIEKQTANGWVELDNGWDIGYTNNEKRFEIGTDFIPEEGYYRATATVGKNKYTDMFRVRNHMATAWLDEYDLNSKDLTISFTVMNCSDEPIKICTFPYGLYQKNPDGTWKNSYIEGAAVEISESAYTILNGREKTTVNFDISNYYNMSELTAGDYAVDIGGIGLAEFTLTDKPTERNFPFKNLKTKDIDEIHIEDSSFELINTAVLKRGKSGARIADVTDEENDMRWITADVWDSSYFYTAIGYLRQLELTGVCKNYDPIVGSDDMTKIIFNDGTEILLDFNGSGEVVYNGKIYYCSKYTCDALVAIVKKFTQRNLPFYNMKKDDLKEILFRDGGCNEIYSAALKPDDYYFSSAAIQIGNLELLNEFEDFDTPVGGSVFSVTMTYKNGKSERIIIYGHDVVLMPDGKAYYCSEWQFDNIYEIFGKLEHSVSYIEPEEEDLPEEVEE